MIFEHAVVTAEQLTPAFPLFGDSLTTKAVTATNICTQQCATLPFTPSPTISFQSVTTMHCNLTPVWTAFLHGVTNLASRAWRLKGSLHAMSIDRERLCANHGAGDVLRMQH